MASSRPVNTEALHMGLECPVCQEYFREPKMLPCGHTLCLSPCLKGISDGIDRFCCPECRTPHSIPTGGIRNFPTNISLSRLLDTTTSSVPRFLGCPVCGSHADLTKCAHCSLDVCDICQQRHSETFRDQLVERLETLKRDATNEITASPERSKMAKDELIKNVSSVKSTIERLREVAQFIVDCKLKELLKITEKYEKEEEFNIALCHQQMKQTLNLIIIFCKETVSNLKHNVPVQTNMATIARETELKELFVSESMYTLHNMLKDITVSPNLEPLKQAMKELGTISSKTVDRRECEAGRLKGEYSVDAESILTRELSVALLCIGSVGTGTMNLQSPTDVTVDPVTKDVVIVDQGNNRIQMFDKQGQPKIAFGSKGSGDGEFNNPVRVAITSAGLIAVSDKSNHRIKVYSREGGFIIEFGGSESKPRQLSDPCGIAVDNKDNIHVCDYKNKRVQVFNVLGQFQCMYDTWKYVCTDKPLFISINNNGGIAIVLEQATIVILNEKTQLLHYFSIPKANFGGICWFQNDYLVLSDVEKNEVQVYTWKGVLRRAFGERGYLVGQLKNPRGVTVDKQGFVYVCSSGNHMVQKF